MTDNQITEEIINYLENQSYRYAVLIDGEWGSGKTYYVKSTLIKAITDKYRESEKYNSPKYISLYGVKSVEELQASIAWYFADDFQLRVKLDPSEKGSYKTAKNISGTFVSVATKVLEAVKIDDKSVSYEIIRNWIDFGKTIYIFDDLERCGCDISDLLGFINSLVEHDGAKVILIANEQEIKSSSEDTSLELQYLIASSERIAWPKRSSMLGGDYPPRPLDFEELERRRRLLFDGDAVIDSAYLRIKEKLVGITFQYEPDFELITRHIINDSALDQNAKNAVICSISVMSSFIDKYSHHNIRTIQFFVEKIDRLYQELTKVIPTDDELFIGVLREMIETGFKASVLYKANPQQPIDELKKLDFQEDYRKLSEWISVREYVENGNLAEAQFERDARSVYYVLKNKQLPDDSFNLLSNGYWLHDQEWVEGHLDNCLTRLKDGAYTPFLYARIIVLFCNLERIGFSKDYVDRLIRTIREQIENDDIIDEELFKNTALLIDDERTKTLVNDCINEIRSCISTHNEKRKERLLLDALKKEDWVNEVLNMITDPNSDYSYAVHYSVLMLASADEWASVLYRSSASNIYNARSVFRQAFSAYDPADFGFVNFIQNLYEKIDVNDADDLIRRFNLECLRKDMMAFINKYDKNVNRVGNAND